MSDPLHDVDRLRNTLWELALRFGPRLLTALLILIAGVLVSRAVSRWLLKALHRVELEPPVRNLLARTGWALSMALFVILALQNLGVELLPLIAGLGVAGAGVALATQGVLSNAVAGLSIIFTRPFRVGEHIAILGVEGTVQNISLFSTTLQHLDLSRVVIPNRKIVGEILHNYGSIRQVQVNVGVAYDTDLEVAFAILREVLGANSRVLQDPAPQISAAALGDSAVLLSVQPWVQVRDFGAAAGELTRSVLEAFRERGINMPLPQREVRMLAGGAGEAP